MNEIRILGVVAREVLDSRGYPTVEVELSVNDPRHNDEMITGRAMVPSGASTGEGEALELRDGDKKRFLGKGVLKAVSNVREKLAPQLIGQRFATQASWTLINSIDGTPNKSSLGANALLGISMAYTRACSQAERVPTSRYLSRIFGTTGTHLPVPLMNIINGGKHADNGLAIQEFMIVPAGFPRFSDALRAGAEVFHHLKKILHDSGLATGVGDEGGFAPVLKTDRPHEEVLRTILRAIEAAGYRPGTQIALALDCAASEFGNPKEGYLFEGKRRPPTIIDL